MKLTGKQEKFAQAIASGMTQSDAYRDAYATKGQNDKTVHENASRLAGDSKVSARVEELKAELSAKTVEKELWTREQSILALVPLTGSEKGNEVVAAVKELNAMHGFSVTKVEHSGLLATMDVAAGLTDAQKTQASIAILRQSIGSPSVEAFAKDVLREHGYEFED